MIRLSVAALRIRPLGRLSLLVVATLLVGGCSQDVSDLHNYISETRARPAPPLDPFEEPKQPPSHRYPADLDRDPFHRLSFAEARDDTEVASGPRPDPDRPKETLERYPLDALRMGGTLARDGERWGLVRDPGGTVHRVREGNYLGQNHGRIVRISENRIEVLELIRSGDRAWREREAALATRDR